MPTQWTIVNLYWLDGAEIGCVTHTHNSFPSTTTHCMSVQNLNSFGSVHCPPYRSYSDLGPDPFAEEGDPLGDSQDVGSQADYIHIRIQQRNGRKTLTTLQGLPKQYDAKKLLKAFKKEFACNGTLVDDEKMGQVIQLQGDQRVKISTFLVENGLDKSTVKVHGF
ncbi:Eukaryotic translation initiation factor 1 [Mycena indigotica]|uniref:Eukaryotic translation initiation factor 1 n=1 Tax=Mycena indigotica TaxID=2126181 RepID=A0A8H6SAC0_9AGAR|nr:Eukaryotic translation initiation factor 1 [Mycena indigotica]KAF7295046.1 Eukaryotic translation initiation factor 1 [Mycena indigotica]